MKSLIDMTPALLFLAALFMGDIYIATAVLMGTMVALAAWYWVRDGKPHKLHTFGAIAVLVLGGLTLFLRDASFVKYKTSVVNGVIALVFMGSHFIGNKVLLARIPQQTVIMPDPVWRRVNMAWAGYFAFIAILNYFILTNFDDRTWGLFKTFGVTAIMFVFLLAHIPFVGKYMQFDQAEKSS